MLRRVAIVVVIVLLAGAAVAAFAVTTIDRRVPSRRGSTLDAQNFAQIERGRYLSTVSDCDSCHTLSGQEPLAGGRPIDTPFGSIVAPNITPDRETGIGAWSDDEFIAAVRDGRSPNGSRLYPAMPFPYYAKLTRDDALAIRAYLNTVKPVHNHVISNTLPFPFNIRQAMLVWDKLYFQKGAFHPDPAKSAEWNHGAYLVEAAGHCGACHTPKTKLGGDRADQRLQGYALQGWFAPDISDDAIAGIGRWSVDDIVDYLKSGHNATTAATGIMAEEILNSSSKMTDADLKAIAIFLKDQPGSRRGGAAPPAAPPIVSAGAAIYADSCSACHGGNGEGVPRLFPALASSANVRSTDPTSLIRVVLEGARSVATASEPTAPAMPAYAWQLNDAQVAAVLSFVRAKWGATAPAVSESAVKDARSKMAAKNY